MAPDANISDAVDVRQELDLRIGTAVCWKHQDALMLGVVNRKYEQIARNIGIITIKIVDDDFCGKTVRS